jgi:hypothetical protein
MSLCVRGAMMTSSGRVRYRWSAVYAAQLATIVSSSEGCSTSRSQWKMFSLAGGGQHASERGNCAAQACTHLRWRKATASGAVEA